MNVAVIVVVIVARGTPLKILYWVFLASNKQNQFLCSTIVAL
jgi:hypothetical protein